MPVDAQYFIQKAGVDPATAAQLAAQHSTMSGSSQSRAELEASLEVPVRTAQRDPGAEAIARFRAAGVDEPTARELARQEAELSRRLPVTMATSEAIQDERLQSQFDAVMVPPDSPTRYQLPREPSMSAEAEQADLAFREALFDAKLPVFAGNAIAERVASTATRLSNASSEQIADHALQTRLGLERMWGAEAERNIGLVDDFICAAADRNPVVAAIVDRAPHLLLDPVVFDQILQVVSHRTTRQGRR